MHNKMDHKSVSTHLILALCTLLPLAVWLPVSAQDVDASLSFNSNNTFRLHERNVDEFNSQDVSDESQSLWYQFTHFGFVQGFIASISMIIVSELGDKTFFIAAIMAMRKSRLTVFCGAISALVFMTLLSCLLGMVSTFIPRWVTHYGSTLLFLVFGIKMLWDGCAMTDEEGKEEFEEVHKTLLKKETSTDLEYNLLGTEDPETGVIRSVKSVALRTRIKRKLMQFVSLVFIETFTMTFLAEWGDRSQIATVVLAARENVLGVTLGACIGHALCTGLAVIGGRFIATMISVRTVTIIGGVIFILFAFSAVLFEPASA